VDLTSVKDGIRVIRRLSGGGAIYTDEGQLVYGLAVRDGLPEALFKCFEIVCGPLWRPRVLGHQQYVLAGERCFS